MHLRPMSLRLVVKALGGRQVKVTLGRSDSVGQLKTKLQQIGGHPASWQHLSYNGLPLDDDLQSVSSYLGGAGSMNITLDMALRPPADSNARSNAQSAASTLGRESGGRLRQIFDRFDADGNGSIDATELQASPMGAHILQDLLHHRHHHECIPVPCGSMLLDGRAGGASLCVESGADCGAGRGRARQDRRSGAGWRA